MRLKATARHLDSAPAPQAPPPIALYERVPWGDPEQLPEKAVWPLRGCLLTTGAINRISLVEGAESLPLLAEVEHTSGKTLRWWELPATTLEAPGDDGRVEELLSLRAHGDDGERAIQVMLAGVAKPPRDIQLADDDDESMPEDACTAASWACYEMLGQHAHVMHEAYGQQPPPDAFQWPNRATHAGLRTLDDVLTLWRNATKLDEPRYALIVRLAETLRGLLTDVCERPRMRLARKRELQRVGRVQQVDAACLRWLARQPGRTVAEKAGPKQHVMGVLRREEADSLENRVVKDLLRRASRAAVAYLHEHRHFGNHERLATVRRFLRLLRRLMVASPMAEVGTLVGIPQPNYVLQHDPRYSKLWTIYLQLIRQDRELDDAWRWRQRIWAESVMLAVIAALKHLVTAELACRSDLLVYGEQVAGRFVHPSSQIAPLQVGPWMIDVILGETQIRQYALVPVTIREQVPDMVLVARHRDATRYLPVWSLVHLGNEEALYPCLESLEGRFPSTGDIAPLILIPESGGEKQSGWPPCTVPIPASAPQRGLPTLVQWLQRVLS